MVEATKIRLGTNMTKIGYIYNFENVSFVDVVNKKTTELLLRHLKVYVDNYPERMKYVHIINESIGDV
ncbi:UNVERIFIED_CONTAM: hypothetical protein NCL1_41841 [Trichonephila clavipes]